MRLDGTPVHRGGQHAAPLALATPEQHIQQGICYLSVPGEAVHVVHRQHILSRQTVHNLIQVTVEAATHDLFRELLR